MQMDGQMDRHDEANSHFLQYCERAQTNVYYGCEGKGSGKENL